MFSRSIQVAMERSEQETKPSSQTQPLNMPNTYQYQTHTHTDKAVPYLPHFSTSTLCPEWKWKFMKSQK